MTLRGRLIALAVVLALLLAAVVAALLGSRTPGCAVAAPRPSLAPALRALGDFDQAYDPNNRPALVDAAARAASALHPDLIGASGTAPVRVTAVSAAAPVALVVPLRASQPASAGAERLDGLVVFLLDCQGNAYFATVEDDASAQPPLTAFPPVSRERATAVLGSSPLHLEYATSPLRPLWVTATSPSSSTAAR